MSSLFSHDIKILLSKLANQPIELGKILEATVERGFSLIICLLALPFLLPMPPGLSGVMGIGCSILGIQMALGRKFPWLPKQVAKLKFSRSLIQRLLKFIRCLTIWLEKIVRSRWQRIANNSSVWKINGLCIAWLSVLLMLPIPLTNPLPAIAILILAIANIESDGLLMCVGYFLTLLNTIFFGFVGYALWQTFM